MQVVELDHSMSCIRAELTQVTQDLLEVDCDLIYTLRMRQSHLLTQLQHLETVRWFSPQSVQPPQSFVIQVPVK